MGWGALLFNPLFLPLANPPTARHRTCATARRRRSHHQAPLPRIISPVSWPRSATARLRRSHHHRSWFLGRSLLTLAGEEATTTVLGFLPALCHCACATARRRRSHHHHCSWFLGRSLPPRLLHRSPDHRSWFLGRALPPRLRHRSPEKNPPPPLSVSWPLSATALAPPLAGKEDTTIVLGFLAALCHRSCATARRRRSHHHRSGQESSLRGCIRRKRRMGLDSGRVISWWAEASCCRWLAALFGCPSRSRGSSPRLRPSSSSTRSQGVQPRKGKRNHSAWLYGKNSKARPSHSTATGTKSSNSQVTVGGRKFPKEVVVAHVDYCRRASVCEKNQRVCHMCAFIQQRCQNNIVNESELIMHCQSLHGAIGVQCEAPGCRVRAMTHEDLELHSYFYHIQAQGWWRQYEDLETDQ